MVVSSPTMPKVPATFNNLILFATIGLNVVGTFDILIPISCQIAAKEEAARQAVVIRANQLERKKQRGQVGYLARMVQRVAKEGKEHEVAKLAAADDGSNDSNDDDEAAKQRPTQTARWSWSIFQSRCNA